MTTATIATTKEVKARFDAYYLKRRAEALSQEGKKSYRHSEALVEIMDKAGLPPAPITPPCVITREETKEVSA